MNSYKNEEMWSNLTDMSGSLISELPSFDLSLDKWFDRNFESVIEEWGLLTDNDLRRFRLKLDFISYEVNRLIIEKSTIDKRIMDLKQSIEELER